MPFTDTCRNIRLDGATLSADCKAADGRPYKSSTLSLDTIVGVVDGQLRWGYRNFSQNAKNIKLDGSLLSADVKTADGKFVPHKLDLNANIHNNKGALEGLNVQRPVTPGKAHVHSDSKGQVHGDAIMKGLDLKDLKLEPAKAIYVGSPALGTASSDVSMTSTSGSSLFSASSSSSSATSTRTETNTHSETKTTTTSTSFEMGSKVQLSIRTTCKDVRLDGFILMGCCFHASKGTHVSARLDLNTCIGFVDGKLVWGEKGFSRHCKKIQLVDWVLIIEFEDKAGHRHRATLNLWEGIHNIDGEFCYIEIINAKFSTMLSEVPWMKFRVVAEPDMSVFAAHPVLRTTMARIAQSTVEHVTIQMQEKITKAITEAISSVTVSAMEHVQSSLEVMVKDVAFGGGHAHVYGSCTETEDLHILREGDRYFEAVNAHRHHYHNGNGYGREHEHSHGHGHGNLNGGHVHIDYCVPDASPLPSPTEEEH